MCDRKEQHLEALCAVCRELGAEVRYRPEYHSFTAMVWDGWDWPRNEAPALAVQQQIQRHAAQYPDLVCYCFDAFSTLVYAV